MAWDDTPPAPEELGKNWDQAPPTEDELAPPTNIVQSAVNGGKAALKATSNTVDYLRGALGGPVVGKALELASGKPVFSGDEYLKAITPFSGQAFPSSAEMLKRAGVPEGGKLSDVVGGYNEPGQGPWYHPEKGGMLDPTLRGGGGLALDIASDPLTYVSGGAAGLARKAMAGDIVRQTAENAARQSAGPIMGAVNAASDVGGKTLNALTMPAQAVTGAIQKIPFGQTVVNAATAPSKAINWAGTKLYNSLLSPVEAEGAKFGKEAVGENLYKSGVKNPLSLGDESSTAATNLLNARNKIQAAQEATGQAVTPQLTGARAEVAKIRSVKDPAAQELADKLDAQLDQYEKIANGTPGTAPTTKQISTGVLDESGNPIMRTESVAGKEAIPGSKYNATDLQKLKTFVTNNELPNNAFASMTRNSPQSLAQKALAGDLKGGAENLIGTSLGPEAQSNYQKLNEALGNILSTRRGTQTAENQANRLANAAVVPGGTGKILGILGGPGATLAGMGADLGRVLTMPVGYGVRKATENAAIAPMLDAYLRRKAVNNFSNQPGGQ